MTQIVSNSEVEAFQKCERLHMFAYTLGLTPTENKESISIGTIGHRGLSAYYKAKFDGYNHEECVQAGMLELSKYMGGQYMDIMPLVTKRFMAYVMFYANDPIEILAVEAPFIIPLTDQISLGFTPDIVVCYTGGPFVNKIAVWDHKWSYNFWTDSEVQFAPQLPKYMWGLRQLGYDVDFVVLNQVRTREIKEPRNDQLFKRARRIPTEARMENLIDAHISRAAQIIKLPDRKEWFNLARPSSGRMNCKDCFFKEPCDLMLENRDPRQMLSVNYILNDTAPVYDKEQNGNTRVARK